MADAITRFQNRLRRFLKAVDKYAVEFQFFIDDSHYNSLKALERDLLEESYELELPTELEDATDDAIHKLARTEQLRRQMISENPSPLAVSIELPSLADQPTFDGNPLHFNRFWAVFKLTVWDIEAAKPLKMDRLIKAIQDREVVDILEGYDVFNYDPCEVEKMLKSRYTRPSSKLVEFIEAIKEMPSVNGFKSKLSDLEKFYNVVSQIHAHQQEIGPEGLIQLVGAIISNEKISRSDVPHIIPVGQERDAYKITIAQLYTWISDIVNLARQMESKKISTPPRKSVSKAGYQPNPKVRAYAGTMTEKVQCTFGDGPHRSKDCPKTLAQRLEILRRSNRCEKCFRSHDSDERCYSRNYLCRTCRSSKDYHHYLLCKRRIRENSGSEVVVNHTNTTRLAPPSPESPRPSTSQQTIPKQVRFSSYYIHQEKGIPGTGHAPTGKLQLEWKGQSIKANLFYDRGTSHTMISPDVARRLNLECKPITPACVETLNGKSPPYIRACADIMVHAIDGSFKDTWNVLISTRMPVVDVPDVSMYHHLLPANMEVCEPGQLVPDIVIGVWHATDIVITPSTPNRKLSTDIMIEQNRLGWTLLGRSTDSGTTKAYAHYVALQKEPCTCHEIAHVFDDPLAKSAERDPVQDRYVEKFSNQIRYDKEEKRFYASFTWLSEERPPDNFEEAFSTCYRIFNGFRPVELLDRYQQELDALVEAGYAEILPNHVKSGYFIPHHPVIKPGSTTAVRPVFNASFTRKGKKSLNELLFQGAWRQTSVTELVIQWRTHEPVVFADLKKAFLQVKLEPQERKFTRFLWFRRVGNAKSPRLMLYQMNSVLFGATASPFILYVVLCKLFREHAPAYLQDFANYVYMDDGMIVANSMEELKIKFSDVQRTLSLGSFTLHKFGCTPKVSEEVLPTELRTQVSEVKVLGMHWNTIRDEIYFPEIVSTAFLKQLAHRKISRREVASLLAKLFDPIGLLAPFTLKCRRVLRECFRSDGWDDPLPEELLPAVIQIFRELHHLKDITFPRVCVNNTQGIVIDVYIDGSSIAYSAAAYIATPDSTSKLLCARTRLAPKEQRTVPQMELCGAVLGVEIGSKLKQTFKCPVRYFARTTTTVDRIRAGPHHQDGYEAHRIKLVRDESEAQDWHYIAKKENPATLAAIGRSLSDLQTNETWRNPTSPNLSGPRVHAIRIRPANPNEAQSAMNRFLQAPYHRIRVFVELFFAMLDRKYHYLDRLGNGHCLGEAAFIIIWKVAQRQLLGPTIQRVLTGRTQETEPRYLAKKELFFDQFGLMRLDMRMEAADVPYDQRFRLVLPQAPITSSFLKHMHNTVLKHAQLPSALARLRQVFVIPDDEQRMRAIVDGCLRCQRYNAPPCATPMAPLPSDRVVATHAFDVVGIDIFGQLRPTPRRQRRNQKKKKSADNEESSQEAFYVLIFVCAQSRGIHLEPILSKSTKSVKNAILRFCSLYGTPRKFISDNEKSFQQMSSWLKAIRPHVEQAIAEFRRTHHVTWEFNPPRSPWYGGFFERLIQVVKKTLRAYKPSRLGSADELYTILAEVQSIVNSRPLTRVPGEVDYLTPYHLIYGRGVQPLSYTIQAAEPEFLGLVEGQRALETKLNALWRKWREVYLPSIRAARPVEARLPRVGDLVILNEPTRYRATWPIAVVKELHSDRHGVPHRATIKKIDGTVLTNISLPRLYPVEHRSSDQVQAHV